MFFREQIVVMYDNMSVASFVCLKIENIIYPLILAQYLKNDAKKTVTWCVKTTRPLRY